MLPVRLLSKELNTALTEKNTLFSLGARMRIFVKCASDSPFSSLTRFAPWIASATSCSMRVGGEVRSWRLGECLAFDDSFVHEVWHHGDGPRGVLIVDMWHPDLTPAHRETFAAQDPKKKAVYAHHKARFQADPVAAKWFNEPAAQQPASPEAAQAGTAQS